MHPMLEALQAALHHPSESTLAHVRETAWITPLWFSGSMLAVDGDRILIRTEAQMLEGFERSVLFAYIDEAVS